MHVSNPKPDFDEEVQQHSPRIPRAYSANYNGFKMLLPDLCQDCNHVTTSSQHCLNYIGCQFTYGLIISSVC